MKQQFESVRSGFLLLLAAFIWGIAFVAQSVGMDYMGPCTFNASRFLIGGVVLLPVIWTKERMEAKKGATGAPAKKNKSGALLPGGVCCGIALCAASLLQQFGIRYTSVGKAGFLTTLYIVIVPLLGIFVRRIPGVKVWCSVVAALIGMYLLCISGSVRIGLGDALVIGCAFVFSIHILVVDHFAEQVDGVKLSCLQFLTSGVICLVLAFLTEHPSWNALFAGIVPVLYAGVLSSGVGYTLQVVGQKKVEPTVASLILSMESIFSVLAGWVILGQRLSAKELFGCVLVFAAILLAFLLSLCSSSDAVVARSMAGTFSTVPLLGFLVFGPMMDIKNVMMLRGYFKASFIVRLALTVFAVCFGVVLTAGLLGGGMAG